MSNPKRPVSTVEEFIKVFHEMSARYGHSELWYDYIRQTWMGHAMLLTFTTSTTIWMMVTALWWTILSTMMLSTHSMSMTLSTRRCKHVAP